jgi:hypothetical protein
MRSSNAGMSMPSIRRPFGAWTFNDRGAMGSSSLSVQKPDLLSPTETDRSNFEELYTTNLEAERSFEE